MKIDLIVEEPRYQLLLSVEEMKLILQALRCHEHVEYEAMGRLADEICHSKAWSGINFTPAPEPRPPHVVVVDCDIVPTDEQSEKIKQAVFSILGRHIGVTRTIPTDITKAILKDSSLRWTCKACHYGDNHVSSATCHNCDAVRPE